MRIIYLCPDYTVPSGGIKRLYMHVKILVESGYNAHLLHFKRDFKPVWFDIAVPTLYLSEQPNFYPEDTIVIPESQPLIMRELRNLPVKKVAIALSFIYLFEKMPLSENWSDYGIDWVMANNKSIADFIRWSMHIQHVYIIGSSIDKAMFYFEPEVKKLQVAYMAKKDTLSPVLEKILKAKALRYQGIEFVRIENLPLLEYARVLRESGIFLTTSTSEGYPRPILEAMACGCVCIGFDGVGARDFIVDSGPHHNFIRSDGANFIDLTHKLVWLLEKLHDKDPFIDTIRQNGLSVAARFTPEHEKESILAFWKAYLAQV